LRLALAVAAASCFARRPPLASRPVLAVAAVRLHLALTIAAASRFALAIAAASPFHGDGHGAIAAGGLELESEALAAEDV